MRFNTRFERVFVIIKKFKMAAKENCGKVSLTFQKDWSEKFGEIQVRKIRFEEISK